MEISERGYWIGTDRSEHQCDRTLGYYIYHLAMMSKYKTVLDVGCGDGSYVKLLYDHGIEASGYDGNPNTPTLSDGICGIMDFSEPRNLGKFDMVICLEVGEHVPEEYEEILLDNIANHAEKAVVLSWAIPDQGGFGHVNCRDNKYIISKMKKRGFVIEENFTAVLREHSEKTWFKRTLMVFEK
jgi:cyclopropane fatty-acyl-phospholipid synthase-like methyltransferase